MASDENRGEGTGLVGLEVQVLQLATEDGKGWCRQGKVTGLMVMHRSKVQGLPHYWGAGSGGGAYSKERMCVGASACVYH